MYPNLKKIGFVNRWYKEALACSMDCQVDTTTTIRIFSAVYFVASKLEAYHNRGKEDCRFDNDFADVIYIVANRDCFVEELQTAPDKVQNFIVKSIKELVVKDIEECILALGPNIGGQQGTTRTYQRLQQIAALS
jgi:hypothetical protein